MPQKSRTVPCGAAEGRARFRTAQAYLEVAKSVLDERDRDEYLNVAAGLAVQFAAWHLREHGSTPDPEVAEVLAEIWLEGALPGTRHAASPHRARSRLDQLNEDFVDDPVITGAKMLLPEWVRWHGEESSLPKNFIDRSVAVASGEHRPSAGGAAESDPPAG